MKTFGKILLVVSACAVLFLAWGIPATHAVIIENLIQNASFETGPDPGTLGMTTISAGIDNWNITGTVNYTNDSYWNTADLPNTHSVILNASSSISQSVTLLPNATYSLVYYETAVPNGMFPPPVTLTLSGTVKLGNTNLFQYNNTSLQWLAYGNSVNNTGDPPWSDINWSEEQFTFATPNSLNPINVVLTFSSSSGNVGVDAVSLNLLQVVPIPASVLLLGSGLLGLGLLPFRRKKIS